MKKVLTVIIALILFANFAVPAAAVEIFTPPSDIKVSRQEIEYAETVMAEIKWDTSRADRYNEIILSLPKVKWPYLWSLEMDVGRYTGIRVEWKTAYMGQGGVDVVIDTNGKSETGYYLSLINLDSTAIISSNTYIYYSGSGMHFIPPEDCIRGATDEDGRMVGYYDLWGRPIVVDSVYSPDFPNKYIVFSDLKKSHWAYDVVYKLTSAGYLKGYPDGSFKPDENITRAEFAAVLSHLLKNRYPDGPGHDNIGIFPDFTGSHWSYGVVNEMLSYLTKEDALNIFGRSFKPEQKITREEVVAVIHAVLKNNPEVQKSFLGNITFPDLAETKFADSISFCASLGFIKGYPDGTFRPGENITRAEIAAILVKISEIL